VNSKKFSLFFVLLIPTLVTSLVLFGIYLFSMKGYEIVGVTPTRSMCPTYKDDTKLIVNWNPDLTHNLTNEVIIFSERHIAHRCIADNGEWLTTKGDNSNHTETLTRNEIRGIVVAISVNPFFEMIYYGWFG